MILVVSLGVFDFDKKFANQSVFAALVLDFTSVLVSDLTSVLVSDSITVDYQLL